MRKWQGTVIPAPAGRKAAPRRMRRVRERGRAHARARHDPCVRDLQVRAGPALARGPRRPSRRGHPGGVIPHYDNNEGGTHDTRFCYLGERRLSMMERGPARRRLRARRRRAHRLRPRSRRRNGVGGRSRRRDGALGGPLRDVRERRDRHDRTILRETAAKLARDVSGRQVSGSARELAAAQSRRDAWRRGEASRRSRPPSHIAARRPGTRARGGFRLSGRGPGHGARGEHGARSRARRHRVVDGHPGGRRARPRPLPACARSSSSSAACPRPALRDPRELVGPFVEALLELRNAARNEGRFAEADLVRERLADRGHRSARHSGRQRVADLGSGPAPVRSRTPDTLLPP